MRAMKASRYNGVSYEGCEAFDDYRFEGLGDVIVLNPAIEISEDIVQVYDAAYRDGWNRA